MCNGRYTHFSSRGIWFDNRADAENVWDRQCQEHTGCFVSYERQPCDVLGDIVGTWAAEEFKEGTEKKCPYYRCEHVDWRGPRDKSKGTPQSKHRKETKAEMERRVAKEKEDLEKQQEKLRYLPTFPERLFDVAYSGEIADKSAAGEEEGAALLHPPGQVPARDYGPGSKSCAAKKFCKTAVTPRNWISTHRGSGWQKLRD